MLTQKQEAFCMAYIETGNASEAYRQCYNSTKMLPESINRKAKELMDNGKIASRLTELRAPVLKKAQVTLESHLQTLLELREGARSQDKFDAAIKAEVARGKVSGLYIEKAEVEHSGGIQFTWEA